MGLRHGDLKDTIVPLISLDEFEPKSGTPEEVIVLGLYATDEEPAKDLNTFIQRGSIDALDTEVSPNPDELGHYVIFIEFERNEIFRDTFPALIKDLENLTGKLDWKVRPYLSDEPLAHDDPELDAYIITDPELYMPKSEFKMQAEVAEALENSDLSSLTFSGPYAIMSNGNCTVAAKIVDVGPSSDLTERNQLVGYKMGINEGKEIDSLRNMLGQQWMVIHLTGKGTVITEINCPNNRAVLLTDTQYVYRTG